MIACVCVGVMACACVGVMACVCVWGPSFNHLGSGEVREDEVCVFWGLLLHVPSGDSFVHHLMRGG